MASPSANAPKLRKKGSTVRKILITLIILIVLAGILVALIPTILSSNAGKSFILGKVNPGIQGEIQIDKLKLSWFGGQSIEGFRLLDPQGATVAQFDQFRTGASIWGILTSKRVNLGDTRLDGLVASVKVDENGGSNLQDAVSPKAEPAAGPSAPSSEQPPAQPAPPSSKEPARIPVPITGNIAVSNADITVSGPGFETVTLTPLTLALAVDPDKRALDFDFSAVSKQGQLSGSLDAKGALTDFLADDGTVTPDNAKVDISATAADFPVEAIDHLSGMKGLLTAALDSPLGLTLTAKSGIDEGTANVNINTPNLKVDLRTDLQNKRLALASPGRITFDLTPALVEHLLQQSGQEGAASLEGKVPVTVNLNSLGLPMGGFEPAQTSIDLGVTAGDARIRSASFGRVAVRNLTASLNSSNLTESIAFALNAVTDREGEQGKVDISGDLRQLIAADGSVQMDRADTRADIILRDLPVGALASIAGVDAKTASMIGPKMTLTANASRDAGAIKATLDLKSKGITANLPLTFGDSLRLSSPGTVVLTVDPDLFMEPAEGDTPPSTINVKLNTLDVPFPKGQMDLASTKLNAAITSNRVAVNLGKPLNLVSVNDLNLTLNGDSLSNLELGLNSLLRSGNATAPLTASGNIRNLMTKEGMNLDKMTASVDIEMKGMNPGPWGALFEQPPLGALLGNSLDVTANVNLPEGLEGSRKLTLGAESSLLHMTGAFNMTPTMLQNTSPMEVDWTLTPEGYQAYREFSAKDKEGDQKPDTVKLAAPSKLTLSINSLKWPLGESASFKPSNAALVVKADIPSLTLNETQRNVTATLEKFTADIQGPDLSKPLTAKIGGDVVLPGEGSEKQLGTLNIESTISDLLLAGGIVNTTGMGVQVNVNADKVPVDGLDVLIGAEEMLSAAFGESLNAGLQAKMKNRNGTVSMDVESSNTTAGAALALSPEAITLTRPITAQAEVTPDMGRVLLSKVNPLLVTAVSADNPIRLKIQQQGFRIPTGENAIAGTQVGEATLQLGTIHLANGSVLSALAGFLKADAKQQITAEFTPLKARVVDGVATYDRMDIVLAGSQRLATWGTIDLVNDYADMVLGITAESLDKAFGIESVDPDYILEIPMTGPTSDVKVNWGAATAQIAKMVAKEKLGNLLGGNRKEESKTEGGTESGTTVEGATKQQAAPNPIGEIINIFGSRKDKGSDKEQGQN